MAEKFMRVFIFRRGIKMSKVLCIGSITADVIVSPVSKLPEPGTMNSVESTTLHVGGCASNAAIDMSILGVQTVLAAKVGNDEFGNYVRKTIAGHGVDVKGLISDDNVNTTVSIVCVDNDGERSFIYMPGSTADYNIDEFDMSLLDDCDIVFYTGAMLMTKLDGAGCAKIMKRAKELGKYTIMDTAWDFQDIWLPKIKEVIPYLDLFMPSIDEAAKLTGETDCNKIADKLFELGAKNVIIKWGKNGALVCPAGQERRVIPTYRKIKSIDTTGAGDSFCAGFIAGQLMGWDYYKSAQLANAVGTHCIMGVGAHSGIKPMADILKFMEENKPE